MKKFGIIGNPVAQSYSAKYFTSFFEENRIDAVYERYCCPTIEDARAVIGMLDGFNVTIPHKQAIIPLLDELDETAQEIGAVNVVKMYKGSAMERMYKGYNTDAIGFMDSIQPLLTTADKKALVLGTGGASKAVCYGLKKLGVEVKLLSRSPHLSSPWGEMIGYDYLKAHPEILQEYTVIVNATPLGMWPDVDRCPDIPYDELGSQHLLFDCIYNPEETLFLQKGREHGCRIMNGMGMLLGQAKAAWRIWEG